jgi:hypothetical protein
MDDDTKCNELKRLPSFESVFGLRVTAAKSKQGFAQDCWSSTKTTLEKNTKRNQWTELENGVVYRLCLCHYIYNCNLLGPKKNINSFYVD